MKLTVKNILEICHGSLICGNPDLVIENYSKDTRTLQKNDCYVGIRGENFDGNQYWKAARENGAIACIVDSFEGALDEEEDFTIILVENSIDAIQSLARYIRENISIPVIGVTGSVGKTSTKDMIAAVLSQRFKVLKSPGNLNGQIGLPFHILNLKDEEVMVLEMGMNDFGQMSRLTSIAKPNIAVITNIGTAHIGILGSRENILKAKLEILEGMKKNSDLVINYDNDLLNTLELKDYFIHTCGIVNASEYQASQIEIKINESDYILHYHNQSIPISLPVMGEVFVSNSLLAVAVGDLLGLTKEEIKKGLESITLSGNRMEINLLKQQITLINDTYNSNFEAVVSALHILKDYSGKRKIAVLGDILEMDDFAEEIHRKIGALPVLKEIDAIFLSGPSSKFIEEEAIKCGMDENKIYYFESNEELEKKLLNFIKDEDTILMKASNGMHFKDIAEHMKEILHT